MGSARRLRKKEVTEEKSSGNLRHGIIEGNGYTVTVGERSYRISPADLKGERLRVSERSRTRNGELISLQQGNRHVQAVWKKTGVNDYEIWIDNVPLQVSVIPSKEVPMRRAVRTGAARAHSLQVVAPMPGIVKEVSVRPGDHIRRGQRLAVLEAMKMENEILAKDNGIVRHCRAEAGMSVEKGELIMELTQ